MKPAKRAKYLLFIPLAILGFFLAVYDYNFFRPASIKNQPPAPIRDSATGLVLAAMDQPIELDGYRLTWSNPRYENDQDLAMYVFKANAVIEAKSAADPVLPVFNCDIIDGETMVKEGSGVLLDETHELLPGEKHGYVVTVPLEIDYDKESQSFSPDDANLFPGRRVSACSFTPTGSYDPNISVKILFE